MPGRLAAEYALTKVMETQAATTSDFLRLAVDDFLRTARWTACCAASCSFGWMVRIVSLFIWPGGFDVASKRRAMKEFENSEGFFSPVH